MISTKQCSTCNKIISIVHFRNNKNDKFFKTCYYCREKGRILREKYKNKKLEVINSDILNTDMLNTDMLNTDMLNTDILDSDILDSDMLNIDMLNIDMLNTDMLNTDMLNTDMLNTDMLNTDMLNTDMLNTDILDSDILDSDMLNIDMLNIDMLNTDMLNTDMLNTDMLNTDMLDSDVLDSDVLDSDMLNKNTILTVINRNLFTRNILLYIFELDSKVQFKKPELNKYDTILCFNDSAEINSITDDTIVDSINIDIFIEKIRRLVYNEKIEIETIKNSELINIHFINRYKMMTLQIDDSWREIYKFMKVSKERNEFLEFICPICMESKNNGILTCHNCLKGKCAECVITLFIKNEGLMICPYCRYTIGQKMSQYKVKYIADCMLKKLQQSYENYYNNNILL